MKYKEYRLEPTMMVSHVCQGCGAIVYDKNMHDDYHDFMLALLQWPDTPVIK